jgi:sugar-specific transcriptional regulator TrmB
MPADNAGEQPVELLQELGLNEYESKCFVGLTRVTEATAKEISGIAEIPRTRVYDAMRVLESGDWSRSITRPRSSSARSPSRRRLRRYARRTNPVSTNSNSTWNDSNR